MKTEQIDGHVACHNTDKEIFRLVEGDLYAPYISVTQDKRLNICIGGNCVTETVEAIFSAVCLMRDKKLNDSRVQLLAEALQSIGANTCCDTCREAALVARAALAEAGIDTNNESE